MLRRFWHDSFAALADGARSAFVSPPSLGAPPRPIAHHSAANPTTATASTAAPMSTAGLGCGFFPAPPEVIAGALVLFVSRTAASSRSSESATERSAWSAARLEAVGGATRSYAVFFSGLSRQILAAATSFSSRCDSAPVLARLERPQMGHPLVGGVLDDRGALLERRVCPAAGSDGAVARWPVSPATRDRGRTSPTWLPRESSDSSARAGGTTPNLVATLPRVRE